VARGVEANLVQEMRRLEGMRKGAPLMGGRVRGLIRDRDDAFGPAYTHRVRVMRIRDHPTAARSPWQNATSGG